MWLRHHFQDQKVWHLSVLYIGPKSRTERPRKTKIGTEVAHVTCDSDTTFKIKRSKVNFFGGQKRAKPSPIFCFALLWQCRHKVGKIAQCLFICVVVVVCLLANSAANCSFHIYSWLWYDVRGRGGGILCRHAQGFFTHVETADDNNCCFVLKWWNCKASRWLGHHF